MCQIVDILIFKIDFSYIDYYKYMVDYYVTFVLNGM